MSDINLDDVVLDAEEFLKSIPNEDKLSKMAELGEKQVELTRKIAKLEDQINALKEEYRTINEVTLPALMDEVGLSEFKLSKSNLVVRIKPFYSGKITDEAAYKWLEEHEYGDIIKGAVTVNYPKGFEKEKLQLIAKAAETLGLPADIREEVHHSTLRAWLKEMVETGQEFPRDLFNCYVGKRANISLK